jgi:hypothetical protein
MGYFISVEVQMTQTIVVAQLEAADFVSVELKLTQGIDIRNIYNFYPIIVQRQTSQKGRQLFFPDFLDAVPIQVKNFEVVALLEPSGESSQSCSGGVDLFEVSQI